MATIEEQMGTLQQQVQMLVQALQESQARAEAAQVTHLQQMVELQGRVVEPTAAQTQARRVTFVDVKGIGKPSSFASAVNSSRHGDSSWATSSKASCPE